jgi:hypothetical protein
MVRAVDAGVRGHGVSERRGRGRRLVLEHVEPHSQTFFLDGGGERGVVHHLGARGIDDICAPLRVL